MGSDSIAPTERCLTPSSTERCLTPRSRAVSDPQFGRHGEYAPPSGKARTFMPFGHPRRAGLHSTRLGATLVANLDEDLGMSRAHRQVGLWLGAAAVAGAVLV